ncbi:competence protein ComK [Planococcus shenhongbingii]|uniref:Competence protein ComK n=1 Tax=Planococcus shenhongbingii TaxID=3058398 RepID=A0ABT8N9T8_9BACL|nr:competence protein ComK [Planococcus sp. N017]MDN7244651.1 competence protein ComK [Planococcus sp. N017]
MKRKNKEKTMKFEYVITAETTIVLPNYNENGFLHALIGNGEGFTEVELSPYELIDINLRYRGSSLRGAMDGAEILVRGTMNPIVLDQEEILIFFPSSSPTRKECVWFGLRHIVGSVAIDKKLTQVNLSNGSAVSVNVSKRTFDKKLTKAYELQYKIQERKKNFENLNRRLQSSYHLYIKENGVNYETEDEKGGGREASS